LIPLSCDLSSLSKEGYKSLNLYFLNQIDILNYVDKSCLSPASIYFPSDIGKGLFLVDDKENKHIKDIDYLDVYNEYSSGTKYIKIDEDKLFMYEYSLKQNMTFADVVEEILGEMKDIKNYDGYKRVTIYSEEDQDDHKYFLYDEVIVRLSTDEKYNLNSLCERFGHNIEDFIDITYIGINKKLIENTAKQFMNRCSNDRQLSKIIEEVLKSNCRLDNLFINIKSGNEGGIQVNNELIGWDQFSTNFRFKMINSYKNNNMTRSM
jgi:hypothetical protein